MEQLAELAADYAKVYFVYAKGDPCVDWAVERLRFDQEGGDLEIALLASARGRDEVMELVEIILERYDNARWLDHRLLAGKYLVELRRAFLQGTETTCSLVEKIDQLFNKLGAPGWLEMLTRNCEYATDIPEFEAPFEQEFAYISSLWNSAASFEEFSARYSRATSNQHDPIFLC